MRGRGLSIGLLASGAGVNLETVRYYERIGLMPAPDRTEAGHRHYRSADQRRLRFIRRARELGFSIDDIRTLLSLAEPTHRNCREVQVVAGAHLEDVRTKIADLVRLEAILAETVNRCSVASSDPNCPVLEMLEMN